MQKLKKVQICAQTLRTLLPQNFSPVIGLVLGTGLGQAAALLTQTHEIPYSALPDFPLSTVPSHQGHFTAGFFEGLPVIVQQGRCHLYEGKTPDEVCTGVRVMAALGIKALILTNAAGALNPQYAAGSLMLIEDQINLTGQSPLTGPNIDEWGPRFPDMSRLYDPAFIRLAEEQALALGIRLEKGVYLCIPGPQLETRAETRAYRQFGSDAIGMSTALEAIAAKHLGLRLLGLACLSNKNLPDAMEEIAIEDIIRNAAASAHHLEHLLRALLPLMAADCHQDQK